jgi:hypothetical protein
MQHSEFQLESRRIERRGKDVEKDRIMNFESHILELKRNASAAKAKILKPQYRGHKFWIS